MFPSIEDESVSESYNIDDSISESEEFYELDDKYRRAMAREPIEDEWLDIQNKRHNSDIQNMGIGIQKRFNLLDRSREQGKFHSNK